MRITEGSRCQLFQAALGCRRNYGPPRGVVLYEGAEEGGWEEHARTHLSKQVELNEPCPCMQGLHCTRPGTLACLDRPSLSEKQVTPRYRSGHFIGKPLVAMTGLRTHVAVPGSRTMDDFEPWIASEFQDVAPCRDDDSLYGQVERAIFEREAGLQVHKYTSSCQHPWADREAKGRIPSLRWSLSRRNKRLKPRIPDGDCEGRCFRIDARKCLLWTGSCFTRSYVACPLLLYDIQRVLLPQFPRGAVSRLGLSSKTRDAVVSLVHCDRPSTSSECTPDYGPG